ncbi:glycosyltransferase family 4 protein [Parvularcula sp. LCG005]|uniref:glycosyltransferase family 4 protein n=1 Tax=Parvularcula sp. LCG005 TaxID=3078805 RepID=UPI002942CA50|nr:glycosyltransferase family 4 protein [Parvularcula sp. LCG005]WOI53215.1 glycosyltransferase family 4 protein [Parvularcula sp. LCG005]
MRILYSHRTRAADGQYVHIASLTNALARMGHEVLLCGPEGVARAGETPRPLETGIGPIGRLRKMPFGLYEVAELAYSLPAYWQLARAAEMFKPDVLYERYNLYYHAGEALARKRRLPYLLEVNAPLADERRANGELRLYPLARRSETRLWRRADAVLPVTAVLGQIIADAGADADHIHVIPNGVDADTLQRVPPDAVRERYQLDGHHILGFVGFVREWHGVDRVIDWLATSDGQAAILLVVGDGPAIPALKAQAEKLGVSDRFIVTGVVQRADIPGHVAAFDIALQPAVTAYASPLKLQEYMAQGRAIIAPDQPNIRETVTDGETALLVDPADPSALFTALDRLCRDRQLREGLGRAAHQRLLERNMTWEGNAQRVVDIARTLIADAAS